MKAKRLIGLLFIAGVMTATFNGCKKYEDVPAVSLGSKKKRVVNTCRLHKCYWNCTEATSLLLISGYTEEYTDNNSYSRFSVPKMETFSPIQKLGTLTARKKIL